MAKRKSAVYKPVIEDIFLSRYKKGATEISFTMADIVETAAKLKVDPGNRADISYNFRNRSVTPQSISITAPSGFEWVIRGTGKGNTILLWYLKPLLCGQVKASLKLRFLTLLRILLLSMR